eukprot:138751-Rhodomonas_salina.1
MREGFKLQRGVGECGAGSLARLGCQRLRGEKGNLKGKRETGTVAQRNVWPSLCSVAAVLRLRLSRDCRGGNKSHEDPQVQPDSEGSRWCINVSGRFWQRYILSGLGDHDDDDDDDAPAAAEPVSRESLKCQ